MKKLLLSLLLLVLIFSIIGCEEEELAVLGEPAPKYARLLDLEPWLDFATKAMDEEMMYEEDAGMMRAIEDAFGYKRISQEKADAHIEGNLVFATNTMVYDGPAGDDSLLANLLNWEPGNHDFSEGFDPSELYGLIAVGNPEGFIDAVFEWLTDSQSFENFIKASTGGYGNDPETRFQIKTGIMTAKGYWYTIQEDIYPIIGDELVIAVISNPDWVGPDDYGDDYDTGAPFKTIIALETEEEGLSEDLDYLFENYLSTMAEQLFGMGYMEPGELDEYFRVNVKKVRGYEIHFLNFDGEFMPGWLEYDGGLFISDLKTLERIDDFYDSSRKVLGAPDEFNTYIALNADALYTDFVVPYDEDIKDELKWMVTDEEIGAVSVREMYNMLSSGKSLGIIQLGSRIYGNKVDRILTVNPHVADILMLGIDYLDELIKEEMKYMEGQESETGIPGIEMLEEE